MIFTEFKGKKLSQLGMGAMRLPVINGADDKIDKVILSDMVNLAMKSGINYYDTALGYHGGNSETIMGQVLKAYPRSSFYIATKFPGYDLSNMWHVKEIFEKQLEKLQMDYFDFYLFHNVCEMNIDAYLDSKFDIRDYLVAQKKSGRIRHLGFSCHGSIEVMRRFLEAYRDDVEFCQIQLNYLDWKLQNAQGKVSLLNEYNLPIWVMEPVRGGKLAALNENQKIKLARLNPAYSFSSWALRFARSIPNVKVVLSGMSDITQLKENIETFSDKKLLSDDEKTALFSIADEMLHEKALPCTSCHYCLSKCPQKLNIPALISLYNEYCITGGGFIASMGLAGYAENKRPSACIECRSCEKVCPQKIKISEAMHDFAQKVTART